MTNTPKRRRLRRWATTGRIASQADVAAHPATTTTEDITDADMLAALRWERDTLRAVVAEVSDDLRIAQGRLMRAQAALAAGRPRR